MKQFIVFLVAFFCSSNGFGQVESSDLKITHLKGDYYVYTTYNKWNGNRFPSNSMYVLTSQGVILIDTPWDSTQFQPLLDSIWIKHKMQVKMCLVTHFHDDRTAGLGFLNAKGIATYSTKQTFDLCADRNENQAKNYFVKDTVFTLGEHSIETFYGGEGHTIDNIVVWFGDEKILYGGCLVKSIENKDIGNIADANTGEWVNSILKIESKFPKPRYVIPGHFNWSGKNALRHTIKLVRKYEKSITTK